MINPLDLIKLTTKPSYDYIEITESERMPGYTYVIRRGEDLASAAEFFGGLDESNDAFETSEEDWIAQLFNCEDFESFEEFLVNEFSGEQQAIAALAINAPKNIRPFGEKSRTLNPIQRENTDAEVDVNIQKQMHAILEEYDGKAHTTLNEPHTVVDSDTSNYSVDGFLDLTDGLPDSFQAEFNIDLSIEENDCINDSDKELEEGSEKDEIHLDTSLAEEFSEDDESKNAELVNDVDAESEVGAKDIIDFLQTIKDTKKQAGFLSIFSEHVIGKDDSLITILYEYLLNGMRCACISVPDEVDKLMEEVVTLFLNEMGE